VRKLFTGKRERLFRKKIGEMLANGDCQAAARYAFKDGRLELGAAIAQSCQSMPPK
jgi:hypothetical protein